MPSQKRKANRYALPVALALLLVAWLVVQVLRPGSDNTRPPARQEQTERKDARGLNRHPEEIVYSKHARCRMDCRRISKEEVEAVLQTGTINYRKSELGDRPECRRKYAVEGHTADGQRVRIIFAPCREKVTVVTVIDLGREWACDCP